MSNNKITYQVGFQVDSRPLQEMRKELDLLQQLTYKDFKVIDATKTKQEFDEIQNAARTMSSVLESSFNAKLGTVNLDTFQKRLAESGMTLQQYRQKMYEAGDVGKQAFQKTAAALLTTKSEIKQTHTLLEKMSDTLGNTIKWSIASSAINLVTGSIQKAWGFTKNLDTSLNDIMIVTGKSADEMERFAKQSNRAAKELGASTTEYTKASLIFYQQGLGDSDVAARTETTIKAANVTGQSTAEVSEQLTAVWNGYKVVASEAEMYVDKLAAVAASTAADLEELATGMSKVASAASTMGVDIDQLSAQLSTIVSVTRQDASLVGTALKTIYARMGDLEVSGVDEFGTSLGDVSGQLRQMGIDVLDQEGNLRDMGTVIEEVAEKWGTWTDAQQQAAAVAIAGKRQYNNLIALFENWDMYESSLTTSQASAGTLQKQQNTYMDSLEAHLARISTAGEKVYQSFFDSDSMKDMLDFVEKLIEGFGTLLDSIGGGGNMLLMFGSLAGKILGRQLGQFVGTATQNLIMSKRANVEKHAEYELTQQLAQLEENNLSKEDAAYKDLLKLKEKQLKLEKGITDEQKKQNDELFAQKVASINQNKGLEEEIFEESDTLYELTGTAIASGKMGLQGLGETAQESSVNERLAIMKQTDASLDEDIANNTVQQDNLRQQAGQLEKNISAVSDAEEHLALEKELLAVREKLEKAEKEGANLAEIKTKHLQDEKDLESHLLSIHEAKNKVIQEQKNLSELSSGLTEASLLAKEEGNVKANENAYMDKLAEDGRSGLVRIDQKTGGIDVAAEEKRLEGHLRTETVRAEKNKGTEKGDKASANVKKLQEELALLQKVKKAREEADKVQAKTSNTNKKVASSLASTLRGENQSVASQKAVQNALSATGLEQQEAIDLLNQAEQGYFQSEQAAEKYAKLIEELQKSTTAYNEELKELEKNLEATAQKTDQAANTQENLDNKIKDTNKSLNAQQLAQNITGIAGALTSLIGVIDAVSNISSIAKDEDLERGEKVKQIIVAILSILVAVIGVIPPLVTGVKFLGTETFFAGLKAQAGWLPYVAVILAIVAILALIIGLVLLFTRDTETGLEKANKALEKQKEDLAAVNEQYKKMQEELAAVRDSFDELAEKQKIINDLQVGTEEWTKAVQENNQAVMDLVSQYGELAGAVTVDSNGVMSITQEGQEQLEAKLQKQTNQAYANTLAQQANVMKAQQKVDSLEAGKAFGEGESYDFAKNYDTEQLEKILVESKSQEDLEQALKDNGMATEDAATGIAEAMWEERDAIYENISSINNNSDAIKKLEMAYAASFFADNAYRENAESTAAWDAMMGNEITKAAENAGGAVDDDEASDGKDQDELDSTAEENYAKSLGVSVDELEYTDDGKVKVKGADDSTAVSLETAVSQGQKYAGAVEAEKQAEEITKRVNTMAAAAESAGNKGLANLAGGQKSVSFDENETTVGGMSGETLDASKDAIFSALAEDLGVDASTTEGQNAIAKELGYESYGDYELAFEKTKKQAKSTVDKIGAGNLNSTFNVQDYSDATIAQARTISDSFEQVFKSAGNSGAEALKGALATVSDDPELQAKMASIAGSIDWTDLNAENQLKAALEEAGIYADDLGNSWEAITTAMESAANVAGTVVNQYSKMRSSLAEIQDLAGDLSTGEIVSDEDYKKMIAYNSEAKDMFIQTANGYEFIGKSGSQLQSLLSSGYGDLNEMTSKFQELRSAAGVFEYKFGKEGPKVSKNSEENIATATAIQDTEGYADLLAAQGINKDEFDAALAKTQEEGVDTSSEEYKNALEILKSGISAVGQAQADSRAGKYDESQAVETWVSYNATSWDEAKSMLGQQGITAGETYDKFEEKWKNTFLSDLGMGENYETSLGADELQTQLENIRKLELDYYAEINNQLDAIGIQIDKAFGTDKINLLKQQVNLQNQSLQLAAEQAASAKDVFDTMFNDFVQSNSESIDMSALKNEDGTINFSLPAMNDLLASTTDEGTKTTIQSLIDMWGTMTDTAAKAAEAGWAVIDAQVAAFKTQHEGQIKVAEFSKAWADFSRRFEKFTNYVQGESGSLNVYGAESAADTIANSFAAYGDNKKLFQAQTNMLDGYPNLMAQMESDYAEYKAKAKVEAEAKATMDADYQAVLDAQQSYAEAQQATKEAEQVQSTFETLYSESQKMVNDATAVVNDKQNAANEAQEAQNKAMQDARDAATADTTAMDDAKEKYDEAQKEADKAAEKDKKNKDEKAEKAQEAQEKYLAEEAKYEEALAAAQQAAADAAKAETQAAVDAANVELEKAKAAQAEALAQQQELLNQYSEYGSTYEEISANLASGVAEAQALEKTAEKTVTTTTTTYNESVGTWEKAAEASQKAADTLAENNPYAVVGADGSLLFDAQAFGDDWEAALSSAQSTLEEMQGNLQAAYQGFISAQGEMMALFDKEKSKLNSINSILQSSADLWKIIGKSSANYASNLNSYYSTMAANSKKSYDLSMEQLKTAQAEYEKVKNSADASDEMLETVTNNLATASQAVMDSASEWMTAITTQFGESLNATFDTFVKNVTGYDLAGVTEEWQFATKNDEKYLDDVNANYGISNLEREFQKSIDATDSVTAQKKLNAAMQEQLKILKEKDKLSQYDLDRANAMYDLTLKQIALEEAQQTANKMKLTRDASGNYTYQYVQDQDAVAQAEADLAAAENDLYNMDKDRNKELVDEYYSTMSEANSSIAEAVASGDMERAQRLRDHYFGPDGLLAGIQSELGVAEENLSAMGTTLAGADWTSSFESFTSAITESDLNKLAKNVDSLMTETKSAFDTVSSTVNNLMTDTDSPLLAATNALQSSVKAASAIDTSKLMDATSDVLDKLPGLTADISALTKELDSYGDAYESWLKENTGGMDTNTKAINDNTAELQKNNELLESSLNNQGGSGTTISTSDNTDGEASQNT